MHRKVVLLCGLIWLGISARCPAGGWDLFIKGWPQCIKKVCCDDYCPKPPPPVYHVKGCCCDDYCPKPLPEIHHVKGCCCDNYCPKPLPEIICPSCRGLVCPLPQCCCKQGHCSKGKH